MPGYLLQGKAFYAKVLGAAKPKYEVNEGNEWSVDVKLDEAGLALAKKLGIDKKVRNRGDERGDFLTFRRNEIKGDKVTKNNPIKVLDNHGEPWDQKKLIGNGSIVNVKFSIYVGRKGNKPIILAMQV